MKKLCFLFILLILTLSTACNKEKTAEDSSSNIIEKLTNVVSKTSILEKLPSDSIAFIHLDTRSGAYQKFIKSPLGSNGDILTKVTSQKRNKKDSLSLFLNNINASGILPNGKNDSTELLSYLTKSEDNKLSPAVLVSSKNNKTALATFNALKALDSTEELKKIVPEELDGITVKNNMGYKFLKLSEDVFISQFDNNIFISSNIDEHNKIANGEYDKFDFDSEDFLRVKNEVNYTGFLTGFLNFEEVVTAFPQVAAVPAKYQPFLNLIPRQAYFASDLDKDLKQDLAAYLPTNQLPEEFKFLADLKSTSNLNDLSSDSFFGFNIDLSLVTQIFAMSKKYAGDNPQVLKTLGSFDFVNSYESLSIGLGSSGISGIPELELAIENNDASNNYNLLNALVKSELTKKGLAKIPWQQKEIGGLKSDFLVSPFGVGLYMANKENRLLFSSSENGLSGLANNQDSLTNTIEKDYKIRAAENKLISTYLNYKQVYKMFNNLRNMFGLFIPKSHSGNINQVFKQLENFKDLDSFYSDVNYADDFFRFHAVTKARVLDPVVK